MKANLQCRLPKRGTALLLALLAPCIVAATPTPLAAPDNPPEAIRAPGRRPDVHVSYAVRQDRSPPLRDIPPAPPNWLGREVNPHRPLPNRTGARGAVPAAPSAGFASATVESGGPMPPPLLSFEGVNNVNGVVPPDTNADVGPQHIVQWVNFSYAIWNKSGGLLYGPVNGNTLWSGFGGICETHNNGDPIVQYDQLADRWLMSQLAFTFPNDFHQCIAVSQTGDPTGAWYRYDYLISTTNLNDYPKFGVWPDAYYMSINQYDGVTEDFRGQGAIAFERDKMLTGAPARMVYFDLYSVNPNFGGALPSDLDGPVPPPAGAPNYFVEMDDDAWGWPSDQLKLWKFHVDWTDPSLSTFGLLGNPDHVIDLTAAGYPFDSDMCGYSSYCIPQPGGTHVDAVSDRLMYRLAYRNFGDHETLVVNHTVDVDGLDHAGIRWYEIRDPGGLAPVLYQAGTFAPDSDHRWMASMALDGAGDAAVGYSVCSSATYPSIRYAGRLATDSLGSLPQAEAVLIAGSGYQTGAWRWGDYSSMSLDPTDDCTFWYTQEYYATISPLSWQTRIGSFRFDSCKSCPLVGLPSLTIQREAPGVKLSWTPAANASVYDVVEGKLLALRNSGGDFTASTSSCLADDLAVSFLHVHEPDPAPGDGLWYLVRGERNGCRGTFDEPGGSQVGLRDGEIGAAAASCP